MNEISVVLTQTPGKVSWNFDEVKEFLSQEMEYFRNIIYDDDTIKTAKEDRASLNKLVKQIDAKKKEAKEKCLEPYQIIENQAKELKALIQGPVDAIDEQVKAYEERRKEKVKEEIGDYFNKKYQELGLPDDIRKKAIFRVWDSRWLNVSTSKKTWKDGVDNGLSEIQEELETIKSFNSEWEDDGLDTYRKNLSLREAINTMNDLARQKERVLEMERKKQEESERKKLEEEEEKCRKEEKKAEVEETDLSDAPEDIKRQILENDRILNSEKISPENQSTNDPDLIDKKKIDHFETVLKIKADKIQLSKIKGFIKYVGATYEDLQ